MQKIQHNTDASNGPMDGVSLNSNCVLTHFTHNANPMNREIINQEMYDCRIAASYELGTFSLSVRDKDVMVTARIDEAMAVLMEAAQQAVKNAETTGK